MTLAVSGALPLLGAADLLQILSFNHRSVRLLTASDAGKCTMQIVDGRLRDVALPDATDISRLPFHLNLSKAFALVPQPEAGAVSYSLDLPMSKVLFQLAMQAQASEDGTLISPDNQASAFVEGHVGALSLIEMMQIFENNGRTVELILTPDKGQSVKLLLAGGLMYAGQGYAGPDHVYAALGVNTASFRIIPTTTLPEEATRYNIASVVMEGLRRIDESRRQVSDEPSEHAAEMLQALDEGELSEKERLEMARQYMPGGEMTPVTVVARLAVDESADVRIAAIKTMLSYSAEVLEALACDELTPVPVLRFLLKESGSRSVETAAIANPSLPSACLLEFMPLCASAHMDALRLREAALREDSGLRGALLKHPGCPYREWLEELDKECAPRLRRHVFGDTEHEQSAADLLDLERPLPNENEGERVGGKIGPKELQFIAKRGSLRQKMSLACGNDPELAVMVVCQPGIPDPFLLAVAESTSASSAALSWIGGNTRCRRNQQIVRTLLFNPKTPVPSSASLLSLVRKDVLTKLECSRDVPDGLRQQARQLLQKKAH